jgi:hypothetical protein
MRKKVGQDTEYRRGGMTCLGSERTEDKDYCYEWELKAVGLA